MKTYILVRAFYSVITLWLLVTIIFAMVRITGDPVKMKGEVGADAVYLEQLRSRWGLDKSLPEQYTSYGASRDFGHSFEKSLPVRDIYFERLPNSLKLGFAAFLISIIIGIPLGMLSALKVNTWWDSAGKVIALLGLSMPASSSAWSSSSSSGCSCTGCLSWAKDRVPRFIWSNPSTWMPFGFRTGSTCHARVCWAGTSRSDAADHPPECSMSSAATTSSLCALKGVPEPVVVAKHLKNSMIPVTLAGLNLLVMVNVAVEVIFNWPGVGQLLYDGLSNRDFPMVQGVVLMSGLMIVMLNL